MTQFRIDVWPVNAPDHPHLDLRTTTNITEGRVYFLRGRALILTQVESLCRELLSDPVTEEFFIDHLPLAIDHSKGTIVNGQWSMVTHQIDVTLLPGVTDSVAENLLRAAREMGIESLEMAATGQCVKIIGDLSHERLQQLALDHYANPVIQRFTIDAPITPPFVDLNESQSASDHVELIPLTNADNTELLAISKARRLALDLAEMRAIQTYYRGEGREPTDIELEMLAQTWSEHCVHKTFKAVIEVEDARLRTVDDKVSVFRPSSSVNGLLKTYIRAATEKLNKPWVKSAFVDNAGIIEFDEHWDLAFKVETHNHPSALEPFGGANTGLGGVIRDVLGVSARPIANTDVLCFGPIEDGGLKTEDGANTVVGPPSSVLPEGVLPPKRVYDGVVKGIEDYGNKMGIPTVNGAIYFHPGYTANPLVFAGCLGLLPKRTTGGGRETGINPSSVSRLPSQPRSGDLIIAIGGRTGRDGLRGATFSSMEMDTATSQIAGSAVQIGHPIHEKQAQEAILQAHALGLYHAITDCGAGGFSSAVGEMASGLGATVQLQNALLKYPGLQPWEIWLSEAQERMVLAVAPEHWPQLKAICDGQDIDAFSLGTFEDSGRLKLLYGERTVGEISIAFLHEGIPQRRLKATMDDGRRTTAPQSSIVHHPSSINCTQSLITLLAHPNIRSREDVIRKYDHEVKGQTAVKPLVGVANAGPSDAAVLVISPESLVLSNEGQPLTTQHSALSTPLRGVVLSNGLCPQYGELDPYAMAWAAIDEAVRNAVAVGADPDRIAILDNFCWGNPNLPDRLGSLVECARGCHDAALAYGTPFISGKDSLNNEYTDADGQKHAIPGTLLISALGIAPDVNRTCTMDLKQAGDFLFVIGETRGEMGGSHYSMTTGDGRRRTEDGFIRPPSPVFAPMPRLRALHTAILQGWVAACHDCSEGGLGVALAEMCLAGRLGAEMKLGNVPVNLTGLSEILLFCESLGRFIVEIKPEHVADFEALMRTHNVACAEVGRVWDDDVLRIYDRAGNAVIWAEVKQLEHAFRGHLPSTIDHLPLTIDPSMVNSQWSMANGQSQKKHVLILHANGSNRDHDAAAAITLAGGAPEIVHVNQLFKHERNLMDYHMLLIPGGFTYGDDLGSGVLWALDLRERLGSALEKFIASGRPVLGICNGFQALVKAGLLEDGRRKTKDEGPHRHLSSSVFRQTTLTFNQSQHFECRWVYLQANANSACVFTQGIDEPIYCPVAHGEGRFMVHDEATLAQLQSSHRIALTYMGEGYPANPNGSVANIAGICNAAGNVMGLMPHPENHIFYWQHPRQHRGERGLTGLRLFENGIRNA